MKIAGIEIGPGHPCRIVAEISNNHNGDRDRCGRLIDAAKAAGADFVKFQCYGPEELVALRGDGPAPEPWGSQGWTMRTLYEKARTPFEWFPQIAAHCERLRLPWFSSVFGPESLAVLETNGCSAYKISVLDNHHEWLYEACRRTGKEVLVSTREMFLPWWCDSEHRLYCPAGYPATDARLPIFTRSYLGLSSHCLAPELPIAAVARGCKLIEMHVMLDDEPSELESNVSLTAMQFAQMVCSVRATEALLE